MTAVTLLAADGQSVAAVIKLPLGTSLMEAAVRSNLKGIEAECGGLLTCATCHVYVSAADWAKLSPPDADETAMLEYVAAERRPTSRLSCQLRGSATLHELTVQLPERQVE